MNARRALIIITVLSFAAASLAAALPSGRTAEAAAGAQQSPQDKAQIEAALSSGKTGEAPAPQDIKPVPAKAAPPAVKKAPVQRTEPIVPAYQNIKEKAAVQVFFVWLWLSIGVLLYFLRWWVQEADRVYKARFYEPAESPRKDNPLPPLLGE